MDKLVVCLVLLVAVPAVADDDPHALAEAGWKAYMKHDLAGAERLTRQAIAVARDDRVRGAALYNLGRVLEDRNDKPGAIAAYRESLAARHSGVVRDRLGTLDRAAADSFDTFKPAAMKGPFATLQALCKDALAGTGADCATVESIKPKSPYKVAAPAQDVQVVYLMTGEIPAVVVKVGGQWYGKELGDFQDSGRCRPSFQFDGVTAHAAVLQVSFGFGGECNTRDGSWTWTERDFVAIGVGASKKPSVTPPFRIEIIEVGDQDKKTLEHIRKPTWGKDGSLDIAITRAKGETAGTGLDDTEDIRGHHTLGFP